MNAIRTRSSYAARSLSALAALALGLALAGPAAAAGGGAGSGAKATAASKDYDYYLTGSTTTSLPVPTPQMPAAISLLALVGGGTDVDEAFRRMVNQTGASSASPMRFVVVRASGADGYNPYIPTLSSAVGSVETLVVKTAAGANLAFVVEKVRAAHAVFIAGGDQSDYVKLWNGSLLEQALKDAMTANKPVGGTSAGLAVLGGVDFTALRGGVTSTQALLDPYNRYLTLGSDFIETAPQLTTTLLDSHFVTRDRLGRTVTFLARMSVDVGPKSLATAKAIGVNEETALMVSNGIGNVVGNCGLPGSTATHCNAYFLRPAGNPPGQLLAGKPLDWNSGVTMHKLSSGGGSFDLVNWLPSAGTAQVLSVSGGTVFPVNPY